MAKVVVTVLDKTKMIANGVEARIVHDQVSEDGEVKEDTFDWYAQDADGNPGTSARTRPSTRTGSRRRRKAPGRPASTARSRGSSCPPTRRSA